MDILVFSDSHLSLPFEEKKYRFLEGIISRADQVIINGDFWDGYLVSYKQFIESPWRHLFPLLKQKQAIYVFGNHDKKTFADKSLSLFSSFQTQRYELKVKGITYIFEHGHRLAPLGDQDRVLPPNNPIRSTKFNDKLEKLFIKRTGSKYQKLLKIYNRRIKKKLKKELKSNQYYVCGHTHSADVDHKNRFINTGVIKHGLAQYMWFKNNAIYVKQEKYS